MLRQLFNNRRGFTLLELLIVIVVTIIITTAFVVNNERPPKENVDRSGQQVLSDIRYARNLATSRVPYNFGSGPVFPPGGYGIFFNQNANSYTIYAESGASVGFQAAQDGTIKTASLTNSGLRLEDGNDIQSSQPKYFTFLSENTVAKNFAADGSGVFVLSVFDPVDNFEQKIQLGKQANDGSVFVSLGVIETTDLTLGCSAENTYCDEGVPGESCCVGNPLDGELDCINHVCVNTTPDPPPPPPTSCFPAGTKILMADNSYKNIEDVVIGDYVVSYDSETGEEVSAEVLELVAPLREHMCEISFDGDRSVKMTNEHPVFTKEGWKSINPDRTYFENNSLVVEQLDLGDQAYFRDGVYREIIGIDCWKEEVQTYNLYSVDVYATFFADDLLVHNALNNDCGGGVIDPATKNTTSR